MYMLSGASPVWNLYGPVELVRDVGSCCGPVRKPCCLGKLGSHEMNLLMNYSGMALMAVFAVLTGGHQQPNSPNISCPRQDGN